MTIPMIKPLTEIEIITNKLSADSIKMLTFEPPFLCLFEGQHCHEGSGVTFVFLNETKLSLLSNYFPAKESAFSILPAEMQNCNNPQCAVPQ